MDTIEDLHRRIIACTKCDRLVKYRRMVAQTKRRMYRDHDYWGRPLPGFGDPEARLLLVGLALRPTVETAPDACSPGTGVETG